MNTKPHSKVGAACKQLEMAIALYLGGYDKFSVITLAAAADTILSQALLNQGKDAFLDHEFKVNHEKNGTQKSRGDLGKEMNLVLRINSLKHLDPNGKELIDLDLNGCALAAISVAVANHILLLGRDAYYVTAFLGWAQGNLPPELMPGGSDLGP